MYRADRSVERFSLDCADWLTRRRNTHQVLTKRSTRLRRVADELSWSLNLWMGVSVEDSRQLHRVEDLRAVPARVRFLSCEPLIGPLTGIGLADVHWVIAGGESGAHYRPVNVEWVREIRDICRHEQVPFFFKQWGGRTPKALGRELDGQLWNEMPAKLAG